ncbi:MAG TPA: hypothetical protein VIX12_01040 [Candidatus Binataceae bacterium]
MRAVKSDPKVLEFLQVIREGDRGRSTLTLVQMDGEIALLKNFAQQRTPFRRTVGALMARREAAAYRRLAGIEGIPRLLGRVPPDGLLLQFVRGVILARVAGERLTQDFFQRLSVILGDLRRRSVLHGDIGHNVLMTPQGEPLLVDFGASFVVPQWFGPLRAAILNRGETHDERAIAKLKARSAPYLLTADDRRILSRPLPFEWPLDLAERMLRRIVRQFTSTTSIPR